MNRGFDNLGNSSLGSASDLDCYKNDEEKQRCYEATRDLKINLAWKLDLILYLFFMSIILSLAYFYS